MVDWQSVAKGLAGVGTVGVIGLFSWLFLLSGMSYTHSGDIECAETCESYINVTTTYWNICFAGYDGTKYSEEILFKKQASSRTLHVNLDKVDNIITTDPIVPVDWLVPAVGAGNWRPIQDGDCWERGKVNRIKLVGHKEPEQTVKWSFDIEDNIHIDPLWNGIGEPGTDYVIDGDKVYIETNKGHISAEPYMSQQSGDVFFNVTSKTYTGDLDVLWGFDIDNVRPVNAYLYSPHTVYWNTSHGDSYHNVTNIQTTTDACEVGYEYNTIKRKIDHLVFDYFYNATNTSMWKNETKVVCFDSFNSPGEGNYELTWHQEHSEFKEYKNIAGAISSINYDYGNMTKWYYKKNLPIVANQSYYVRARIDVPISLEAQTGKYWFCTKPSSETFAQAIANDHLYCLDPWWNSSWDYSKPITYGYVPNETLYNFSVPITFNHSGLVAEGKSQADGDDIRFLDETNTTEYLFASEHNVSTWGWNQDRTTVWVMVKEWTAGTTLVINMYYGNPTATTGQAGIANIWDADTVYVYTFSNVSGINVYDAKTQLKGTGTSIVWNNSVEENKSTGSIDFGGSADGRYIIPNDDEIDWENGAYTTDGWVRPSLGPPSTGSQRAWWLIRGSAQTGVFFYNEGADNRTILVSHNNGNVPFVYDIINFNEWKYVSQHRASGNVVNCLYYINYTCSSATQSDYDDSSDTCIGCRIGNANNYWNGQQSFFRVSNVKRTLNWMKANENIKDYDIGAEQGGTIPEPIPEVTIPIFYPVSPDAMDNVQCNTTPTGANATYTVEYRWWNGSIEMLQGNVTGIVNNTNSLITTLGLGNTSPGETWNCSVKTFLSDNVTYSTLKNNGFVIPYYVMLGTVTNGGVGISGARVWLYYQNDSLYLNLTTNSTGHWNATIYNIAVNYTACAYDKSNESLSGYCAPFIEVP